MHIDKLLDYLGWAFLVAAILLLRLAERLLNNIIEAKYFLFEYGLYGTLLSAAVLWLIYKTNPGYYNGGEKRGSAVLSYFFGVMAVFVFGAAYYNLHTAKQHTGNIKAYVVNKTLNTRYHTPYLVLQVNNQKEKFQPRKKEWDAIEKSDTILLQVGKGALGYNYIFSFSAPRTLPAENYSSSR